MVLLLWVALLANVLGIILLLVWLVTGRQRTLVLRIAAGCIVLGLVSGFVAGRM